jgi:hypothetical protein
MKRLQVLRKQLHLQFCALNNKKHLKLLGSRHSKRKHQVYFLPNLQSAVRKLSSLTMFNSGVGSGRPPQVMFLPCFPEDLGAALEAAGALPFDAAGAGDDFFAGLLPPPPPPKRLSRLDGGIFDPGQLKDGMALTTVCSKNRMYK